MGLRGDMRLAEIERVSFGAAESNYHGDTAGRPLESKGVQQSIVDSERLESRYCWVSGDIGGPF